MIHYDLRPASAQSLINLRPFHQYEFDDGTVWTRFYRLGDGYLLRFPELADFEISADGKRVSAIPTETIDATTLEHLYINQVVPLALSRQCRPAFHASVVSMLRGAVAFLGQTGRGKSTLAASFALGDSCFLTDDALMIEEADGACWAHPSHASIRLWEDSVDALIGANCPKSGPISYSSKSRLFAGDLLSYRDKRQPLVAAFVLESGNPAQPVIAALSGLDRYMGWLGNSFLLDIEDRDMLARHFEWTHRISSAVPTFKLDYPRDYGILPTVHEAIEKQVAQLEVDQ